MSDKKLIIAVICKDLPSFKNFTRDIDDSNMEYVPVTKISDARANKFDGYLMLGYNMTNHNRFELGHIVRERINSKLYNT